MRRVFALAGALLAASAAGAWAQMIEDFDSYDAGAVGNGDVMFHQPGFSGSTFGQMDLGDAANDVAQVVAGPAASGPNSLKVQWKWNEDNGDWLRLTTFQALNRPNPAIDFTKWLVFDVLYTRGDPLGIALGARETGTLAPIGGDGGTNNGIEWIGANPGPSPVQQLSASPDWQTFVIKIPDEVLSPFAGLNANGILDTTTGVLEHLAFVRTGSVGPYELYIDNVRQVVPEPGSAAALGSGLLVFAGMLLRRRPSA